MKTEVIVQAPKRSSDFVVKSILKKRKSMHVNTGDVLIVEAGKQKESSSTRFDAI